MITGPGYYVTRIGSRAKVVAKAGHDLWEVYLFGHRSFPETLAVRYKGNGMLQYFPEYEDYHIIGVHEEFIDYGVES